MGAACEREKAMTQHATDNMVEAFERLRRDTCELSEALQCVADRSVADVRESLNRAARSLRGSGKQYYQQCTKHTQHKPFVSLLEWVGVGFLIGWLIGKKK